MKEEILSIASDLREGSMTTNEAKEQLLHLFGFSNSFPIPKCKCGQNALPYKAQIEIKKCSRCGKDR
jgi:hypothetical protein